jgi:hypothetical protein
MSTLGKFVCREALPILVIAICAIEVLSILRYELGQDGWLTLLGGRIVAHGLPHHDTLTTWAHGVAWADQQWLAQLAFYGAYSVGGVKLALLLNAALQAGAFALAVTAARVRGASPSRVALVAVVCLSIVAFAWPLRAQSLAYLLFVALLWLLADDSANPSRRIFLVFPLLVLWANLHGSVVLAAGLVALRGLTFAVAELRARREARTWLPRAAALLLAPGLLIFASPYGFGLADYYHRLLLNSSLTTYIVEWQPTAPRPVTAPFFAAAFGAVWLLGRTRRLTGFESITLLLTIAAALASVRSIAWFGFAAIVLLPPVLEDAWPSRSSERAPRPIVLVGVGAFVAAVAFAVVVAVRPLSWLDRDWSPAGGAAVARAAAADPSLQIVSSLRYADWLLFTQPRLAGRLAFDARLELLSESQVKQVAKLANAIGESWKLGNGSRLFLVDRKAEGDLERVLLAEPGARTLYAGDRLRIVALAPAAEPAG